jgi:glycosyltransferase involved in cell wall biosynthesis
MTQLKIVMLGSSLTQNGGIATVENLTIKYTSSQIEIQHIRSHDDGLPLYRIRVFAIALVSLLWRLLTKQTDAIHIHVSDWGSLLRKVILAMIGFAFRKPVLMHAHGAEFHLTYSQLPRWLQLLVSGIFRRCEAFIVLSNTWKEYYVKHLGLLEERVIVLPNPTELPVQIPNRVNVRKVKLACFGRVGDRKGTFDLIKAYANLPCELKDCSELVIAGDGDISRGQKLVENLNLTEYVKFLGWIDTQARNTLLETVDVFVLPSYNEGVPMALLEAMGWGIPAIVTPVGGIPEVIVSSENGLLVTPGDIQELSEAIKLLIQNEALRLALGNAGRQTVTPLDVNIYCKNLAAIYSSAIVEQLDSNLSAGVIS